MILRCRLNGGWLLAAVCFDGGIVGFGKVSQEHIKHAVLIGVGFRVPAFDEHLPVARALATSAPLGTTFDEASTVGHILDPRSGKPARLSWREITVSAKSAALADALSTAACLFKTEAEITACLSQFQDARLEASHAV